MDIRTISPDDTIKYSDDELEEALRDGFVPPKELLSRRSEIDEIRRLYRAAVFHGTGRYNHSYEGRDKFQPKNGVTDTLESILRNGVQPQRDLITRTLMPKYKATTSLTHTRVYGRCYGEMFGSRFNQAPDLDYEFGPGAFWLVQVFRRTGEAFVPGLVEISERDDIDASEKRRLFFKVMRKAWSNFESYEKKMIKKAVCNPDFWQMVRYYLNRKNRVVSDWVSNAQRTPVEVPQGRDVRMREVRSDIPGNYPVLLGLNIDRIQTVTVFRAMERYESRTKDVIPPQDILFIETPEKFVDFTRSAIQRMSIPGMKDIPIIPMELGEVINWEEGFKECVRPNIQD